MLAVGIGVPFAILGYSWTFEIQVYSGLAIFGLVSAGIISAYVTYKILGTLMHRECIEEKIVRDSIEDLDGLQGEVDSSLYEEESELRECLQEAKVKITVISEKLHLLDYYPKYPVESKMIVGSCIKELDSIVERIDTTSFAEVVELKECVDSISRDIEQISGELWYWRP